MYWPILMPKVSTRNWALHAPESCRRNSESAAKCTVRWAKLDRCGPATLHPRLRGRSFQVKGRPVWHRSSAVEQGNHNPLVGGSNPSGATNPLKHLAKNLACGGPQKSPGDTSGDTQFL